MANAIHLKVLLTSHLQLTPKTYRNRKHLFQVKVSQDSKEKTHQEGCTINHRANINNIRLKNRIK